jgi:predicted MPP superfamily phosphohydrolase
VAAELARLRAPLGVYAVLGNHDWWLDGPRITAALSGARITVLENSAAELRPGLWIAGLADARTRHPDPVRALAGVPADATVLAMTHNPDVFPRVPARVALTVAGHTHGGQVRVPILGAPVVPSHDGIAALCAPGCAGWAHGQRFAAGHIVEDGRHLFVTTGVGTSSYAVRLGVPPEIAVLALNPPR